MKQPLIKIDLPFFSYSDYPARGNRHLLSFTDNKESALNPQICNKPALRNISFEIFPQEIIGVIGPNGAGKTTLLKILSGLLKNTSVGGVYINGYGDISSIKPSQLARIISWMPSDLKIVYDYTIFETVLMGRLPYVGVFSPPTEEDIRIVLQSLAMAGIAGRMNPYLRKISTISSGERQLVYLAQAIAQDTPILIFDEPAAHLDIKHSLKIFSIMQKLATEGKTVIFSHHDINSAACFSTRIAMIKDGSLLAIGAPESVINEQNIKLLYSLSEDDSIPSDFLSVLTGGFKKK